jgi:mRNA interferase MazF
MKRGEVWWVDMPAPAGRSPAVLLSRDAAYRVRAAMTVAPVTRTIRNIPVEVILDRSDMSARCVVNLDDITTVPKVLISSASRLSRWKRSGKSMRQFDLLWTWSDLS